jgi:hypothetical protein
MITGLFLLIIICVFGVPSDLIRNASTDTQLIVFCLCAISDLHIFIRCFSNNGKDN